MNTSKPTIDNLRASMQADVIEQWNVLEFDIAHRAKRAEATPEPCSEAPSQIANAHGTENDQNAS